MPRRKDRIVAVASFALLAAMDVRAQSPYGIGRSATPQEIAGWNIDVGRDGSNLPPGGGTVSRGRELFAQQCASCHGDNGQGGVGDQLVGGQGTLATAKPVRTVGSYWPYAPTLFDYIRRAMPQNAPQSLSNLRLQMAESNLCDDPRLPWLVPQALPIMVAGIAKLSRRY